MCLVLKNDQNSIMSATAFDFTSVDLSQWAVFQTVSLVAYTIQLVHIFHYGADRDNLEPNCGMFVTDTDRVFQLGEGCPASLRGLRVPAGEPIEISELSGKNVIAFASGTAHIIALTQSGQVYSWGKNDHGQLGLGDKAESIKVPTLVVNLPKIVQISCGSWHCLALDQKGKAHQWGKVNQFGTESANWTPQEIHIEDVTFISSGKWHAAIVAKGFVYTWGSGMLGKLGHGQEQDLSSEEAQPLNGLTNVKQVVCGSDNTLALVESGALFAWGWDSGYLDVTSNSVVAMTPSLVNSKEPISEIIGTWFLRSTFAARGWISRSVYVWGEERSLKSMTVVKNGNIVEAFSGHQTPSFLMKSSSQPATRKPSYPPLTPPWTTTTTPTTTPWTTTPWTTTTPTPPPWTTTTTTPYPPSTTTPSNDKDIITDLINTVNELTKALETCLADSNSTDAFTRKFNKKLRSLKVNDKIKLKIKVKSILNEFV